MILAEHSKMAKDDPRTSTNTPGEGVFFLAQVELILAWTWERMWQSFLRSPKSTEVLKKVLLWADFLCRKFFYVHFYVKHRDKICRKSDDFCITLLVGSFAAPTKQFIPNINHQLLWHPFNSLNWKFGFDRFYIYGDIDHLRQWLFLGSNYFGTSARYKVTNFWTMNLSSRQKRIQECQSNRIKHSKPGKCKHTSELQKTVVKEFD